MEDRKDRLEDLERRRIELEKNATKLRASLLHWQAWEIEYEGLKEEILELGEEPTPADIQRLADHEEVALGDTNGSLLTCKEKLDVLKNDKGIVRSREQILNLLSRRIDYVEQNVKTAKSLLSSAQEEAVATEVLREAKALNEEGLPLTEIHEELDENGNVLSSSTSMSGQRAAQAVEVIKQAANNQDTKGGSTKQRPISVSEEETKVISGAKESSGNSENSREPDAKRFEPPKKRVSLVSDMDGMATPAIALDHSASEQGLAKEVSDREADELERNAMAESIIPESQSPEDAALRRQMIQYNIEEVGAVVAEIDLEDDANSPSEYDSETMPEDDEDEEADNEENELEDEFGRTYKSKPLDETFVKRMEALSDKLKAEAMINIGPRYRTNAKVESVSPKVTANETKAKDTPLKKKGVRFAKELDIQEAPEVSVAKLLATSSAMTGTPILLPQDSKQGASAETSIQEFDSGAKKVSKFKAAGEQAAANNSIAKKFNSTAKAPNSKRPSPKILADTIAERPFTGSKSESPASDEFDDLNPGVLKSQISTKYHSLRNRQIQREGGFVRNSEDQAEIPLTEEEGGPKKMSRFKAARLGLQ